MEEGEIEPLYDDMSLHSLTSLSALGRATLKRRIYVTDQIAVTNGFLLL